MRNVSLVALVASTLGRRVVVGASSSSSSSFYSRYSSYPPYCSTPEQMAGRGVPPLGERTDGGQRRARLVHATAVLRHGARTPWGVINCWDDFWSNPDTGVWDCDLTAWLAPPPPARAAEEGASSSSSSSSNGDGETMFLFEKRYDALPLPPTYSNTFNGTCQLGQLLSRGYEQELRNGAFLREAYVYNKGDDDGTTEPVPAMRLIDAADDGVLDEVRYRADDDERTLMSGQVVLRGLLTSELRRFYDEKGYYPVIPLHTADRPRDVLAPNRESCPRLREIEEEFEGSRLGAEDVDAETATLDAFTRDVLRPPRWPDEEMHAIDCLMTTVCTDRPLPEAVDDYGPDRSSSHNAAYGDDLFERLYERNVRQYTAPLKANDAEFARLGMGPLWVEILAHLTPWTRRDDHDHDDAPKVKLSVFGAHDTTVMPLLASIDPSLWPDDDWPPYASLLLVEIYRDDDDANAVWFRLIYNGDVLTPRVPGCDDDDELCDVRALLDIVEPFADYDRVTEGCRRTRPPEAASKVVAETSLNPVARTKEMLSTRQGATYLLFVVFFGALLGASAVVVFVDRKRTAAPVATAEEENDDDDDARKKTTYYTIT